MIFDQQFNLKGTWGEQLTDYGYDFWYKPRHNLLISSEFGSPNAFKQVQSECLLLLESFQLTA